MITGEEEHVDRLMHAAVADGVFPGAVLLVAKSDQVVFHRAYGLANLYTGEPVDAGTVFDLASLTKPLATALVVMHLVESGMMALTDTLDRLLPAFAGSDKAGITVAHLLRHQAGLPAWRPYYKTLANLPKPLRRDALHRLLRDERMAAVPGVQTIYSDLGFMVLQWIVEERCGRGLDRLLTCDLYPRLGVGGLVFIDRDGPPPSYRFAATERCPWRRRLICGTVHDDNAWAMGGVAGQAGLFGTASAVFSLLQRLLNRYTGQESGAVLGGPTVQHMVAPGKDDERPLGFDAPSGAHPSCGRRFSPSTVGHLGYTGTSFWMDLHRRVIVVLLTNRIHPTRANVRIRKFRPRIHDAVMNAFCSEIV
jgi:CubicO group peptidase (beta-lactamase class C family)